MSVIVVGKKKKFMKIRKKLLASLTAQQDSSHNWAVPSFDFMDLNHYGQPYKITKDNVDDVFFEEIYINGKLLCDIKHEAEYEWLAEFWQKLRTNHE